MKRWVRERLEMDGLRRASAATHSIRRKQVRPQSPYISRLQFCLDMLAEYKRRRYGGRFEEWINGCIAVAKQKPKVKK